MDSRLKHFLKSTSFTIFIFTLLGWLYIAGAALVHPNTLSLQLTHLTPWIREDTFGILCFATSFFSFWLWNLLREN